MALKKGTDEFLRVTPFLTEEMLEGIALAKRLRIAATTLEGILTIDNKAALSKPKKR